MIHIHRSDRRCPTCGNDDYTRYPRKFWMRVFKRGRHLKCRQCRTSILWLPPKKHKVSEYEELNVPFEG